MRQTFLEISGAIILEMEFGEHSHKISVFGLCYPLSGQVVNTFIRFSKHKFDFFVRYCLQEIPTIRLKLRFTLNKN